MQNAAVQVKAPCHWRLKYCGVWNVYHYQGTLLLWSPVDASYNLIYIQPIESFCFTETIIVMQCDGFCVSSRKMMRCVVFSSRKMMLCVGCCVSSRKMMLCVGCCVFQQEDDAMCWVLCFPVGRWCYVLGVVFSIGRWCHVLGVVFFSRKMMSCVGCCVFQ